MTKARLSGNQVVAAVIAGAFGNVLFSSGFTILGFVLFGGLLVGLSGAGLGALIGNFADRATTETFFTTAGGIATGVAIGVGLLALVLMALGFLVSGWILRGGKVRKPWAVTWAAILITAVLNLPLFIAYVTISNKGNALPYLLVALLGTVIFGVLVWLWMTWGRRGPASEFAGVTGATASATAIAVTPPAEPGTPEQS